MPIVEIKIFQGRTAGTKRALMGGLTEAVCKALDVPRGDVRVITTELERENFSIGGEPKPKRADE